MASASCSLISPAELDSKMIAAWREIAAGDPLLAGPYFTPEFARAVGSVRRDLVIGVWRTGSELRAFLPFHRRSFGVGKPVAGPMSDYHALISDPAFSLSAQRLLADCRLHAFDFEHWLADRVPDGARISEEGPAYYMDLRAGYDEFFAGRSAGGVSELKQTLKKRRKLEREIGKVEFVAESLDPQLFATMVEWKNQQYVRSGLPPFLSKPWVRQLLDAVRAQQTAQFRGTLSALYAGGNLLAVHFGMRTDKVWHFWYPCHSEEYARYSPGMMLALDTAAHAAAIGIERCDFGKGETRFKTSLGSASIRLASGYFGRASAAMLMRQARSGVENGAARLPIGPLATLPGRAFRRIDRWRLWSY